MSNEDSNLERAVAFTWRQALEKPQQVNLVHGMLVVRTPEDIAAYSSLSRKEIRGLSKQFEKKIIAKAKRQDIDSESVDSFYALDAQILTPPRSHTKKYGKPLPYTDAFFRAFDPDPIEVYVGDDPFEGALAAEDDIMEYSVAQAQYASHKAAAVLFVFRSIENFGFYSVADYGDVYELPEHAQETTLPAQLALPSGKIASRRPSLHAPTSSPLQSIELVTKLLYDANRSGNAPRAAEYAGTLWRLAEHTPYEPVVTDIVTTLNRFSKAPKRALRPVLRAHFDVLRAIDSKDDARITRAYQRIHEQVRSRLFNGRTT
jgi:hypothetical protein